MYTMCIPVFAKDGEEDGRVKTRSASWAISGLNHRKTAGRIAAYMEHFREDLDESLRDIPTAMRRLKADVDCISRVTLSSTGLGGCTWRYIQQHAAQVIRGSGADDVVIGVNPVAASGSATATVGPHRQWANADGATAILAMEIGPSCLDNGARTVPLDSPFGDEPNTGPAHGG